MLIERNDARQIRTPPTENACVRACATLKTVAREEEFTLEATSHAAASENVHTYFHLREYRTRSGVLRASTEPRTSQRREERNQNSQVVKRTLRSCRWTRIASPKGKLRSNSRATNERTPHRESGRQQQLKQENYKPNFRLLAVSLPVLPSSGSLHRVLCHLYHWWLTKDLLGIGDASGGNGDPRFTFLLTPSLASR